MSAMTRICHFMISNAERVEVRCPECGTWWFDVRGVVSNLTITMQCPNRRCRDAENCRRKFKAVFHSTIESFKRATNP